VCGIRPYQWSLMASDEDRISPASPATGTGMLLRDRQRMYLKKRARMTKEPWLVSPPPKKKIIKQLASSTPPATTTKKIRRKKKTTTTTKKREF